MDANLDLLEKDIESALTNYEKQRKKNRGRSANVGVLSGIMAAVTTVLIGLSNIWQSPSKYLSAIAITTSAYVAVLSGWDRIYNHRALWRIYTNAWI